MPAVDGHAGAGSGGGSPPQVATVFPGVPASISGARRFVRSALGRWEVAPDVVERSMLLTSELVTNAYRHGRSEARVSVTCHRGVVRVEVQDSGTDGQVRMRADDPDSETGRGLRIVDALASRWGTMRTEGGTLVWFELGASGHSATQG